MRNLFQTLVIACTILVIMFSCSCEEYRTSSTNNLSKISGKWQLDTRKSSTNIPSWLQDQMLEISEDGSAVSGSNRGIKIRMLEDSVLSIYSDGETILYNLSYDSLYIGLQMNPYADKFLFKRVSILGTWYIGSYMGLHQVDTCGWTAGTGSRWVWDFSAPLTFNSDNTCSNKSGEIAEWEATDSTLTVKYKDHTIVWDMELTSTVLSLSWKIKIDGLSNEDQSHYSYGRLYRVSPSFKW